MNPARAIAVAIVNALKAQSWAEGLLIVRAYRADWKLTDLGDGVTKITILVPEQMNDLEARDINDSEYTVRVLIQKKLGLESTTDPAEANRRELMAVDPMLDLFDVIGKFLFEKPNRKMGPGQWMRDGATPCSDQDLRDNSIYASMRAITYRAFGDKPWPLENLTVSGPDGDEFLEVVGPNGLEYLEVAP
jgi:hypothetical protein